MEILEIVLARTADLDSLAQASDGNMSNLQSSTAVRFLQRFESIMTEQGSTIPQEEIAQLQKKFSEIKHSINNALAVMMALSEMSQRRPDYAEKLASTSSRRRRKSSPACKNSLRR